MFNIENDENYVLTLAEPAFKGQKVQLIVMAGKACRFKKLKVGQLLNYIGEVISRF